MPDSESILVVTDRRVIGRRAGLLNTSELILFFYFFTNEVAVMIDVRYPVEIAPLPRRRAVGLRQLLETQGLNRAGA